jgi:signal transduction histidine kinase
MNDLPHFLMRWLCHDLATPIASVMTASELLDDKPDPEINELIQFGARRLAGRLRLVRLALGAADSAMSSAALERLIREGLDGTNVDWAFVGDASEGLPAVVSGCAMLLADLNRTRAITVTPTAVIMTQGCTWPDSVAAVLSGATAQCNRGAVAEMVMAAAHRAGRQLSHSANGLAWG